jgi:hypothetical protein
MTHFLLVYRRSTGDLLECKDLGSDWTQALEQRLWRERLNKDDSDIEVVVLSARDRQALVRTHSRYFKNVGQLAADLRALAEEASNIPPSVH